MTNRENCVNWIKDYFANNKDGKAIIGISGGKDSTIAAALCVEALGHDRVVGVMMPNGMQSDINDSIAVIKLLGIEPLKININQAYEGLIAGMTIGIDEGFTPLDETFAFIDNNPMIKTNLPARLRMATLYAVAALYPNSRVVNTCNRSEDYVGYSTKFGDAAGDFSPLGNLTVREVLEIGDELGLPKRLVHKAPSDGMCGKTDEDNLGFTYEQLDDYILGTGAVDEEVVEKIERLHRATRHKYSPMPMFAPAEGGIIDPNQLTLFDYSK
jgi:NAD+ synthase